MTMVPESSNLSVPMELSHGRVLASASNPPSFQESWLSYIPLIGLHASRYETTLQQNADCIASELETEESQWSGKE
jgi:hypothetical protein